MNGIENIYSNIHSQYSGNKSTPKRKPLATYIGSESTKWKTTKAGVVCLGLLTFLLLAGIIDQFQDRYSAMTEERDQLQAERDQVQERDQLQAERENLRANLSFISQQIQQGWVYFSSSLYFISTAKKTWEDSRQDCVGRTADLLVINSLEEQVFIHGLNQEGFWIGLTDQVEEGKWMWVDGTELTTGFWDSGQPNSHGGTDEDCIAKWLEESAPEKSWHDVSCNKQVFWVCEKMVYL
uniref:C-type lectin domain-containing protein n=1 Tax=Esox lucius TaxID=8010 RepID=A0A3P8ZAU5_ESOLU